MNDDLKQTIRIHRGTKVGTDSRGHTIWTDPIEPTEFELVSTVTLEQILASNDEEKKRGIREIAHADDGVLVRDTSSDQFEILSDDELQAALAAAADGSKPGRLTSAVPDPAGEIGSGEELSLVTTQRLRRMLDADAAEATSDTEGGYNPYDRG